MTGTTPHRNIVAPLIPRLLGGALFLRATIPLVVVGLMAIGFLVIGYSVDRAITEVKQDVAEKLAAIDVEIEKIKAEGQRLYHEINAIRNRTAALTDDIKRSVEPIRKSMLGLTSVVRTISGTLEAFLNAVIRVLNAVPLTKNIKRIDLPDIKVPGLELPNIDLDIDLEPDLRAVIALQQQALEAADHIKTAVAEIIDVVMLCWAYVKFIGVLILVWLGLSVVGFLGRLKYRLGMAFRLMRGQPVENVWQVF
jgi:prefoldin subunit 5